MPDFEFFLTEIKKGRVEVEADSEEEALDKVKDDGFDAGIEYLNDKEIILKGE